MHRANVRAACGKFIANAWRSVWTKTGVVNADRLNRVVQRALHK
jgi:hypothetical protein